MGAYKDKNGTWYAQFRFTNWKGEPDRKTKRGFATKREALDWERDFLTQSSGNLEMTFEAFYELYKKNMKERIKLSTWNMKESVIEGKILPYFKRKRMCDIKPRDVVEWQNTLIKNGTENGEPYSPVYLKTIHNQLSAIFNHAVKFYDLPSNPARKAGNMGKEKSREMLFWTQSEYKAFSEAIMDKPISFYAFEVLYWGGLRLGEMLALTKKDIDFKRGIIRITKSFQRIKGEDLITDPKTPNSVRNVQMPDFLAEELKDYIGSLYGVEDGDRIFPITKSYLHHEMKRGCEASGVKKIRIHDLRHSHVSLLIDMGFSAVIWNSTTLDNRRKFRNFRDSSRAIARLSDLICIEHQLSVIKNPKRGSTAYNKWHGFKGKQAHRDILRIAIDEALEQKPHDFDAFLSLLAAEGFRVKRGKHITFVHADFKQNIRMSTLGEEYCEDAIRAIIKGQRTHLPKKRRAVWDANRAQSIIDIQAKLAAGKGEGYRRWATVENLKRMAKTKLYMDEHGLSYDEMAERKESLTKKERELSERVSQAQTRLAEINILKTHIVNYSKTRDIYVAYRKSGYSKKFLEEHESDIIIHKAAKKAFDEMGVKKLPTIKSLQVEFADLLTAKKDAYAELKKVRDELRDLSVHKANYEELRDLEEREQRKAKEHGRD